MAENKVAQEAINARLQQIQEILKECAAIADQNDIGFNWDGPGYGMGGFYMTKTECEEYEPDFYEDYKTETGGMWRASSQSC